MPDTEYEHGRRPEREQRVLTRVECGTLSDEEAHGWRSLLGGLEDDPDEPLEALVFCPDCCEREFSDD